MLYACKLTEMSRCPDCGFVSDYLTKTLWDGEHGKHVHMTIVVERPEDCFSSYAPVPLDEAEGAIGLLHFWNLSRATIGDGADLDREIDYAHKIQRLLSEGKIVRVPA